MTARTGSQGLALFDAFYRSGALVFGGGHVVLPLLQAEVVTPGWVSNADFLAGYGMAQAVPGPLFTFAAYLGAIGPAPNGLTGALIALVALSLPGLLLVYGMLPYWDALRLRPTAQAAMRGTNAAVVGILGAALYNPVWTSAVLTSARFRRRAGGLPAADGLEARAMDCRRPAGGGRRHSAADLNTRHRICACCSARHARSCRAGKLKLHRTCCTAAFIHNAKVRAPMQLKAGDRANLPLCRVWNGSNKISL